MEAEKRRRAIALVDSWLAAASGYDKRVWPRLSRAIERNRLSDRRRLEPSAQKYER